MAVTLAQARLNVQDDLQGMTITATTTVKAQQS